MNSANYYSYQYAPDPAHHFEQQNNDAPPAYPGQSGYFCSQCGTVRQDLTAKVCSSCGQSLN